MAEILGSSGFLPPPWAQPPKGASHQPGWNWVPSPPQPRTLSSGRGARIPKQPPEITPEPARELPVTFPPDHSH